MLGCKLPCMRGSCRCLSDPATRACLHSLMRPPCTSVFPAGPQDASSSGISRADSSPGRNSVLSGLAVRAHALAAMMYAVFWAQARPSSTGHPVCISSQRGAQLTGARVQGWRPAYPLGPNTLSAPALTAALAGRYFAFGVVADLFTLGTLTFSTYQFSTNTRAFMEAVQEVSITAAR